MQKKFLIKNKLSRENKNFIVKVKNNSSNSNNLLIKKRMVWIELKNIVLFRIRETIANNIIKKIPYEEDYRKYLQLLLG